MSDIDPEFVPEEEAENPAALIKKLRERLHSTEKERGEYLEGWQRARADFSNLKKDEDVRRTHTEERLKASLGEDLVPILDSFEMALQHNKTKELEVLHKQLLDSLKRMGIERFGAEGDMFDPKKYEALQEVDAPTKDKDHTVASVLRSGYALGEYVIRPAQVSLYIQKN